MKYIKHDAVLIQAVVKLFFALLTVHVVPAVDNNPTVCSTLCFEVYFFLDMDGKKQPNAVYYHVYLTGMHQFVFILSIPILQLRVSADKCALISPFLRSTAHCVELHLYVT